MSLVPPLEIVPLHGSEPDPAVLEELARRLADLLAVPTSVAPAFMPPTAAASADPASVSSNDVVDALIERDGSWESLPNRWVLAVTEADLMAPGREFVFGEAAFGGAWAIVSRARLLSGSESSERGFERLVKEAIHEIGHLAGLHHCPTSECAMNRSDDVGQIDQKEAGFCAPCSARFFERRALDRSSDTS